MSEESTKCPICFTEMEYNSQAGLHSGFDSKSHMSGQAGMFAHRIVVQAMNYICPKCGHKKVVFNTY